MKYFIIFLTSRVIKIFANIIKGGCYLFHVFFPNKRFTIPSISQPIYNRKSASIIPRIIWQTNYTDRVTLAIYINYLFNRLMSYDYEYRFISTQDREHFIKNNYSPEIFNNYSRLQIGAAQADFWRVLVLQKHGGIYIDIDAHFVWPLSSLIDPDIDDLYLTIKRGDISNYFIASKKHNDHLDKVIQIICKNISDNQLNNVYDITGPGAFNKALNKAETNTIEYRYICNQGNFTNEFFQYIDKKEGKWTKAQEYIDVIK